VIDAIPRGFLGDQVIDAIPRGFLGKTVDIANFLPGGILFVRCFVILILSYTMRQHFCSVFYWKTIAFLPFLFLFKSSNKQSFLKRCHLKLEGIAAPNFQLDFWFYISSKFERHACEMTAKSS